MTLVAFDCACIPLKRKRVLQCYLILFSSLHTLVNDQPVRGKSPIAVELSWEIEICTFCNKTSSETLYSDMRFMLILPTILTLKVLNF